MKSRVSWWADASSLRAPLLALFAVMAGLAARPGDAVAADAEPGDQKPAGFLAVRDQPGSQEMNAALIKAYTEAVEEIAKYQQAKEQGKLKSLKPLPLGQTAAKVIQVNRLAERLMLAGEPAGHDMSKRGAVMRADITAIIDEYRGIKGVDTTLARGMTALKKESDKRLKKAYPLIEKLLGEQKYLEADEVALENLDALDAMGVFYPPDSRPYRDLVARHSKQIWEAHVRQLIIDRAKEQVRAAREAQQPDFDGIIQQLQDATMAVGSAGTADVAGESLSGPDVIQRLGMAWRDAQLAATRCQALEWALLSMSAGSVNTKELLANHERFDREMRQGIVALVEADGRRASASEAEALYPQYVRELAEVASWSADPTWAVAAQSALDQLAGRSPALLADVAAYRDATAELLRWRQRSARAQAAARGAAFPRMDDVIVQATGNESGRIGVEMRNGTLAFAPAMVHDVPGIVALVEPHLGGKAFSVTDVRSTGPASGGAASYFAGPAYAKLGPMEPQALAIARLERDLLVGGTAEPLTLEAAAALATARRGDYESVGGEVTGFGLEAAVPRFSTLGEKDWHLVRLGPLPVLRSEADFARRVIFRADLTPAWIQHSCYFVDLRPATTLTQADGGR
jgi:hypothetical protein